MGFGAIVGGLAAPFVGSTAMAMPGALLGYQGVKDTNQTNANIAAARNLMEVQEAAKARDWSGAESQKSRDFQASQVLQKMDYDERMSSTAVQRRFADMKKAGINPILAGKYDASSPAAAAGAGAVGATAKANAHGYTAQNKMQGALDNIGSALTLRKMVSEIKNLDAMSGFTERKKDMTDPIDSAMKILQGFIESFVGNAKDQKNVGNDVKQILKDILNQLPQKLDKVPPSKGNPLNRDLPGVPKSQRKHFQFN